MNTACDILESPDFQSILDRLRQLSASMETVGGWPQSSWEAIRDCGRWFLPAEYGGDPQSELIRQFGYLELASACLTTTFILTQRNSAASRIVSSDNEMLKERLSQQLATNEIFATVGISHLTTSRQHVSKPVLMANPTPEGWTLEGEVPWTTGANAADIIVTGGVQPDGLQVLLALETDLPGVTVNLPSRLLALNESETASVTLQNVQVSRQMCLFGPSENVLAVGTAGGVTTSSLALGAAQKSILGLEQEAANRRDLRGTAGELRQCLETLKSMLHDMVDDAAEPPSAEKRESLRKQANSLVLRAAQAYLTASKGAGFLATHPASRAVREAQFFLVWSCPQPVMAAALAEFSCSPFSS